MARCKSESAIRCSGPCGANLDETVLSTLKSTYGHGAVQKCLTGCRCDEFEYTVDETCREIAAKSISVSRRMRLEPIDLVRGLVVPAAAVQEVKAETSTGDPNWEAWCKKQCAEGMGGSACYCDIIPWVWRAFFEKGRVMQYLFVFLLDWNLIVLRSFFVYSRSRMQKRYIETLKLVKIQLESFINKVVIDVILHKINRVE